ncbi:MAG: DUF4440 domain-containing protein [Microcystaceae cyanobacterium]
MRLKTLTPLLFLIPSFILPILSVTAQPEAPNDQKQGIYQLIEQYNQARENKNQTVLKQILTSDVDQLVSSGEWRRGIENSMAGMLRSSNRNPGQRTITIEEIRLLDTNVAIVDTRYEIRLSNGTIRNLWSTFIVIRQDDIWKIAAIRNMSPTRQR